MCLYLKYTQCSFGRFYCRRQPLPLCARALKYIYSDVAFDLTSHDVAITKCHGIPHLAAAGISSVLVMRSAGFLLKMQPRLLLLPISSHGSTAAIVFSCRVHLMLSSNLSWKFRTLLQDSFSWHPPPPLNTSPAGKNCTGFPFQNVLNIKSLVCVSVNAMNGFGPAYHFWTATCLHSVSYTTLFFWHPHAENPAIQTQECLLLLWTPHLEFTPTRP